MASLYITEFQGMGTFSQGGPVPVGQNPPLATQKLTIGSETKSAAFNSKTTFIRVHADAICSVAFGDNPTATTSDARLAANQTEHFGVRPGDKLSVISNT